jgi:hypothetical protein
MAYNDGLQLETGTETEIKLVLNVCYYTRSY